MFDKTARWLLFIVIAAGLVAGFVSSGWSSPSPESPEQIQRVQRIM